MQNKKFSLNRSVPHEYFVSINNIQNVSKTEGIAVGIKKDPIQ
jgi:hypothetical protein